MGASTLKRPPKTLLEVFKNLPEGTPAQLIKNNIVMSPSPLFRHQDILNVINNQLFNYAKKHDLGKVLVAPMDNYFDDENVFQPDILFVSNERLHVIEEDGLYGAPDLVIEILSPSTAKYDLEEKKDVYERSGVKEYWIIDPATKSVHGYFLTNGLFDEIANDKNIIRSRLLNTEFRF